jgi:hypothetical protein
MEGGGGGAGLLWLQCKAHARVFFLQVRRIKGGYGSWNAIADSLPNRSKKSVKDHGLRLLDSMACDASTRWNADDVKSLKDLIKRVGPKWTIIGAQLGKNPYSCRDKARHHGFTNSNAPLIDGAADDEANGTAISSSYVNWSPEEDSCLLS